jgi:hypothetical protein
LVRQLQAKLDKDPQVIIAETEAALLRAQGHYETIPERRQAFEFLQVHVVYRSPQQMRVFLSPPYLDADHRREFEWCGVESITEIDWENKPVTTEEFNIYRTGIR